MNQTVANRPLMQDNFHGLLTRPGALRQPPMSELEQGCCLFLVPQTEILTSTEPCVNPSACHDGVFFAIVFPALEQQLASVDAVELRPPEYLEEQTVERSSLVFHDIVSSVFGSLVLERRLVSASAVVIFRNPGHLT